jgi:hypothetical protein
MAYDYKCRLCGGGLEKIGSLPGRPGFEIHKLKCKECDHESRVEIDARFI